MVRNVFYFKSVLLLIHTLFGKGLWLRGTCNVIGIGVRSRGVWFIASGCMIGEAWGRILSEYISVPMTWTRVADESHVQLAISG